MKLSEKHAVKSHRVLVYGGPKSGKTELIGKLSKRFNLWYFDLENGIDTLFRLPEEQKARIEVYSIPDTRTLPIAIDTCLKVIKGGRFDICETHGVINCVKCKKEGGFFNVFDTSLLGPDDITVFDSLTQLTNSAIAYIGRNQDDEYKFNYDDWANLGRLMDTFLSHVQQAKFNVACISHETETEMEDGAVKLVPTAGTRNFSRNTAKYFDEVVYCEIKNRAHIAASSTLYSGNVLTGSRSGARLEKYADPSEALMSIFAGESLPEIAGNATSNASTSTGSPAQAATSSLNKLKLSLKK